jgi:hypothetical protein
MDMDTNRVPKPGEIYNHFKDRLYQIITVATHSETGEAMVVYQALYGDFKTYVRPLEMFLTEVDRNKYPDVKQRYRFELKVNPYSDTQLTGIKEMKSIHQISKEETGTESRQEGRQASKEEDIHDGLKEDKQESEQVSEQVSERVSEQEAVMEGSEGTINKVLLLFLDAESYSRKLEVLTSNRKHITDRLINDMAVSLDCSIEEGPMEVRMQGLINCLQAMSRFEDRRLR